MLLHLVRMDSSIINKKGPANLSREDKITFIARATVFPPPF